MEDVLLINENTIKYNLINLRQLVFEVTDRCNLKCKYCAYSDLYDDRDEREGLMMPLQYAIEMIDYLQQIWQEYSIKNTERFVHISFYGGEPLLNMELVKGIIEYVENLPYTGRTFQYGMTTNAMLLDRYMSFIQEKDFQLLISLDGDESGHSYRVDNNGVNSFTRVMSNVRKLQQEYPEYFKAKVSFNSVLNGRNSVESILNFIKNEFDKQPAISEINPTGVRPEKRKDFNGIFQSSFQSLKDSSNVEEIEEELFVKGPKVKQLTDYIYAHSGNVYSNYSHLRTKKESYYKIIPGTCTPFGKKMFITVKGKILSCERIGHQYSVGKVTEEGVLLNFKSIVAQHNMYISKFMNQCMICAESQTCKKCVYQMDETRQEKGICPGYQSEKQMEKKKAAAFACLREHPGMYKRILREVTIRG